MTLEEAIKHAEEVADKKKRERQKWDKWLESDSDHRAVAEKVSCEMCAEEHRQLAEWLKELKQLREQTRWIPVSERLPEIHQDVILSLRSLEIAIGFRAKTEPYFYCRGSYIKPQNVLAWMPLPEPYKAEGSEKE